MKITSLFRLSSLLFALLLVPSWRVGAAPGDSEIARWKNDAAGVFLLFFDDSCPSHFQVVIPELLKRHLLATFYVNPAKWTGANGEIANQWENVIPKTGMVYGDHTMTHRGVKDLESAEYEIGGCQKKIAEIFYHDGKPHLISWGLPGVAKGAWNISEDQLQEMLKKYYLVSRPKTNPAHRAFVGLKTAPEMLALADQAIASKGMEFLVVHGVERRASEGDPAWSFQDFWALNKDVLRGLLNGLASRQAKGDLWVTDHISQYKYQQERDNQPAFQIVKSEPQAMELSLKGTLDPALYDLPLTVLTEVPAQWKMALVVQGERRVTVPVVNGKVRYDAVPDETPISIVAVQPGQP